MIERNGFAALLIGFACLAAGLCGGASCTAGGEPEVDTWGFPDFSSSPDGTTISEENTGVPPGRSLTPVNAPITVTESWIASQNGGRRVLEDREFMSGASLSIETGDFTVRYCRFNGAGGVLLGKPVTDILIQDCEFDGKQENLGARQAVKNSAAGLHLLRVHVHHWPRALTVVRGNTIVENCYLHDLTSDDSGDHIENIYVAGGANQAYVGNRIVANPVSVSPGQTDYAISAALALYNQGGDAPDLENILVERNYFDGVGSYALYGGAVSGKKGPFARNTVARGNVFGRQYRRLGGEFGPVTAFDASQPGNQWSGNTWGPWTDTCANGDPAEGEPVLLP